MWVRYLKQIGAERTGTVAWYEDDDFAREQIAAGNMARVLGPSGVSLEEAAPEDVITQLAQEDGVTFAEKEQELRELQQS